MAAALLAGFALDLSLGGGVVHLPGWAIAAALLLGIDAFVVRAANATHSLTITVDEIRVGDEAVARSDVASARVGVDAALPVLGWEIGLPKRGVGVTVRRSDGREFVVLTRAADQVVRILGGDHDSDAELVRVAEAADLQHLTDIAARADTVFRVAGYQLPDIPYDPDRLPTSATVFVADRPPVAFAEVDVVDGAAHLAEIAVIPGSMRQGIGGQLLERACEWARGAGFEAITLITYADVPWNAPWYRRHGFAEIVPTTPQLTRRRERERDLGLDEVARRIVMSRDLS